MYISSQQLLTMLHINNETPVAYRELARELLTRCGHFSITTHQEKLACSRVYTCESFYKTIFVHIRPTSFSFQYPKYKNKICAPFYYIISISFILTSHTLCKVQCVQYAINFTAYQRPEGCIINLLKTPIFFVSFFQRTQIKSGSHHTHNVLCVFKFGLTFYSDSRNKNCKVILFTVLGTIYYSTLQSYLFLVANQVLIDMRGLV